MLRDLLVFWGRACLGFAFLGLASENPLREVSAKPRPQPSQDRRLARSRPKVVPKLITSRPKVGPEFAQSRPKVVLKSAQGWPKVGPRSAQASAQGWSKIGPSLEKSKGKQNQNDCNCIKHIVAIVDQDIEIVGAKDNCNNCQVPTYHLK